jgi:hypothetical protein
MGAAYKPGTQGQVKENIHMKKQTVNTKNNSQSADNQQKCPGCGMAKEEWMGNSGNGFQMGDKTYCCQGCATGTGCTCV